MANLLNIQAMNIKGPGKRNDYNLVKRLITLRNAAIYI
jgi:hypothetical protein